MTVSCSACLANTCPAMSPKLHWAASSIISLITIFMNLSEGFLMLEMPVEEGMEFLLFLGPRDSELDMHLL